MKLFLIVLLAGFAAESLAKTSCKDKKYMESFELKQMAGTWYEFKWSESIREQILFWLIGRKCTKQVYQYVNEETEKLTFTITKTKTKSNVISTDIANGIVVYANNNVKSGAVKVSEIKSGKLSDPWTYNILAFNPGKYCIVRTCSLLGFESVTVLTSVQHPSVEDRKLIDECIQDVHNKFEAPALSDYKEFSKEACDDN